MRTLSAPALLLDVVDLGERDRIATFLTAEEGKKRGVARGARAKYSRFAGQLQPLAKVEVSWFEKDGHDLVRLTAVELLRPAGALQSDLEGILLGAYLAEHMVELAQEGEPSARFFRLLDTTLEALLAGIDRALAVRYYEVWALRLAGVFPVPDLCPLTGEPLGERAVLTPSDAALVSPEASGGEPVGAEVLDFLRRSGRENLARMAERPPSPALLAQVETLCGKVRRHFLQHELRSYEMMRRTLASL